MSTLVEAVARAVAKKVTAQYWSCECSEQKGLNCDCGDAMQENHEYGPFEEWTREDCRDVARAALSEIPIKEMVRALREREFCSRYQSGSVRRCSACRRPADDARKIDHASNCPFAVLNNPILGGVE